MVHLLGTVQKKIIRIERMKIHRISPPANRNLHPANRVKNMKKLRRNSPFAGLKVNPWWDVNIKATLLFYVLFTASKDS